MKLAYNAAVLVLAVGVALPSAVEADDRQVVAVFDIQFDRIKLSRAQRNRLTKFMAEELAIGGVFQVMPPGDVKKILLEQSTESYKECFDERCQIQLGRQLPANKLVTSTIMKMGKKCRVSVSLYDLKRQTTDTLEKVKSGCGEGALLESIEKVTAKLREWGGGTAAEVDLPPTGDDTPTPSSDSKEYKRALNKAWRKLARSVRKGSTEQKLEKYQQFLADYPVDNPHAGKVQKNIDALEAKLERAEEARRKAEEKKAALAAKRQRAKEMKEAYNEAKASEGSASEQLAAWEQFVADYPDDNPYLKTAKRKIRSLRPRAEEEAERKAAEEKARMEKLAKTKDVKQPGTNLYWLRCPIGQKWTGSSCEGEAERMTWNKATNACPSGYRLPTREELVSLLDALSYAEQQEITRPWDWEFYRTCPKSGMCSSMFGKDDLGHYWSSSSHATDSSEAWSVYFFSGVVSHNAKDDDREDYLCEVRCVRSGP